MNTESGFPNCLNGVQQDLETLCSKFKKCGSTSFADFSELFKAMQMYDISIRSYTLAELVQFNEGLLQLSGIYLSDSKPATPLAENIYGIFACYSFYHLQPTDHVYQISVTPKQVEEMYRLKKILKECNEYDALKCLNELIKKKAFKICAEFETYDPSSVRRAPFEIKRAFDLKPVVPFEKAKDILESEAMKELDCIHEAYEEMKSDFKIIGTSWENPRDDMKTSIEKGKNNYDRWLNGDTGVEEVDRNEGGEEPSTSGAPNTEQKLSVKERAFTNKIKFSKHRRYMDPNHDELDEVKLSVARLAEQILNEDQETAPIKMKKRGKRKKRLTYMEQMEEDERRAEEEARNVLGMNFNEAIIGAKVKNEAFSSPVVAPKRKQAKISIKTEKKSPVKSNKSSVGDAIYSMEETSTSQKSNEMVKSLFSTTLEKELNKKLAKTKKEKAAEKTLQRLRMSMNND